MESSLDPLHDILTTDNRQKEVYKNTSVFVSKPSCPICSEFLDSTGTVHQIQLKNLFVQDVNGSLVKQDRGEGHGIVWENGGGNVKSRFDGLLIENCRLLRTDRNGMCGFAAYPKNPDKWFPSWNVVVRKNLIEDIGGDAIKVWGCDGALVEHNIVRGARQRCDDYAAGIWPWSSDLVATFNGVAPRAQSSGLGTSSVGHSRQHPRWARNRSVRTN